MKTQVKPSNVRQHNRLSQRVDSKIRAFHNSTMGSLPLSYKEALQIFVAYRVTDRKESKEIDHPSGYSLHRFEDSSKVMVGEPDGDYILYMNPSLALSKLKRAAGNNYIEIYHSKVNL